MASPSPPMQGRFSSRLSPALALATRGVSKVDDIGDGIHWLDEAAGAACSFPADTPVATPDGDVAIGDIWPGDIVLAWDETSGRLVERPVTAVSVHLDEALTVLDIDGEKIVATPDHPFLTVDRGWIVAGALQPGDHFQRADGGTGAVSTAGTREEFRHGCGTSLWRKFTHLRLAKANGSCTTTAAPFMTC